jgi:hypothetical protein
MVVLVNTFEWVSRKKNRAQSRREKKLFVSAITCYNAFMHPFKPLKQWNQLDVMTTILCGFEVKIISN